MKSNPHEQKNVNALPQNNATAQPQKPEETWLDKQNVLQELHISARTVQNWHSKGINTLFKNIG